MARIEASIKIPSGWGVATLGELCDVITDGTHFTPAYVAHGIPFFSVESVTNDDFVNVKYITLAEHRKLTKRCRPQRGDILMTRIGSLANTKLIDWDVDASIYVSLALLRPGRKIDGRFLYSYTKTRTFVQAVEDRSLLWAVPKKINMGDIGLVPIVFPISRSEQTAIADVILESEALVARLECLIAKKQAIRQGMLQQLLTGRTRLPGFDGSWLQLALGDAVEFLDHQRRPVKVGDRAKMRGDIPYYGASGVVDHINRYLFDEGLILLGEDGENILSRAVPLAFKISGKSWVNNHAHVLRPRAGFNIDFLTAYLESLDYSSLNTGTAQPKLNKQSCLAIRVHKPSVPEQRAIATALSDVDAEISTLHTRLDKARDIKSGMMQELLTGRTRLAVAEAT